MKKKEDIDRIVEAVMKQQHTYRWRDRCLYSISAIRTALESVELEGESTNDKLTDWDSLITFEWDGEKSELFDEVGKAYKGKIVSTRQLEMMYRTIEALRKSHPSEREVLMNYESWLIKNNIEVTHNLNESEKIIDRYLKEKGETK